MKLRQPPFLFFTPVSFTRENREKRHCPQPRGSSRPRAGKAPTPPIQLWGASTTISSWQPWGSTQAVRPPRPALEGEVPPSAHAAIHTLRLAKAMSHGQRTAAGEVFTHAFSLHRALQGSPTATGVSQCHSFHQRQLL